MPPYTPGPGPGPSPDPGPGTDPEPGEPEPTLLAKASQTAEGLSYTIDGVTKAFDNLTAYRANPDTTVMAVRLLQELGAKIGYQRVDNGGMVTVSCGDITATLWENSTVMTVVDSSGTRQVNLRTVFTNRGGRTYLPTRDVAENLGFQVDWTAEDDSITITAR
ncbi:MAG: copper amine oxidase N-terminal domain-containing protein [Firmicutes bacterium]|nr:copper amine oxidase N-terminal domain-containing protein [Bacillota bacterium]